MDEKYNGYTNRETWIVHLWIDNEPEPHFRFRELARALLRAGDKRESINELAGELEQWVNEQAPDLTGFYSDLLTSAVTRIEWFEIAEAIIGDILESSTQHEIVYVYSRSQAIADGVLIDVSALVREAGLIFPVAMTSAAWQKTVAVPPEANWQDETGRLWDVLNVLRFSIRSGAVSQSETRFTVTVQNAPDKHEEVILKAICGSGDDPALVITIMLPDED